MTHRAICVLVYMASSALGACSGGGGGAAIATSAPAPAPSPAPPPNATVSAPSDASLHANSPLLASAATPNFAGNLPAAGTVFPFSDSAVRIGFSNATSGGSATAYDTGGTTLTFEGVRDVNGMARNVFALKVPALSLDVANIANSSVALPDGSHVTLITTALSYTLLGFWALVPERGPASYWGRGIAGYQTPASGVPAAGTAHYVTSASGGVSGDLFVANGAALTVATLSGRGSVDVNFANGAVAGSLTNMTAGIAGEGPLVPWNDVALSGNLSGAAVRGTTSVAGTPANDLSLGSGAKGGFVGALFGPNAQEIGINWNLYDGSGNGKSASGVLGAAR